MPKILEIRNSTAEFLTFLAENREEGVQVVYMDETIWATQTAMGELFDVEPKTIGFHLQNIFNEGELQQNRTAQKIGVVQLEGTRNVSREPTFYNLDAIISVGYRVSSIRATQFRQWCTFILRQYAIRGYVLDRKRMENGSFIGEDYFEHLLAEIREIRLSERRLYLKLTDIYATSIDYNKDAPTTRLFYQQIQNKMHYAVHQHTAAELIVERADADKEHMGLTTWENAPDGKIVKTDVSIAKNYLKQSELDDLGSVVTAVLEFAESRAKRHIPMTMEDWAKRIDSYLSSDERPLLDNAGSVSHEYAKEYAETEFERYRIIQDRIFRSDFEKMQLDGDDLPELPFEGVTECE
ncbi:MAG: virulence RhuM family protein [Bacteroidales bacterium]|nr:virulence RhuM family protein [Bacteroidales bacterium]